MFRSINSPYRSFLSRISFFLRLTKPPARFCCVVRKNEPLVLSNIGVEFVANGSAVRTELTLGLEFVMESIEHSYRRCKNIISRHWSESGVFGARLRSNAIAIRRNAWSWSAKLCYRKCCYLKRSYHVIEVIITRILSYNKVHLTVTRMRSQIGLWPSLIGVS